MSQVISSVNVDDRDANITYWTPTGAAWTVHTNVESIYHLHENSDTFTDVQGATATLRFYGDAVEYWGNQGPYHGPCGITLDGQAVATVNSHADRDDVPILLYGAGQLELGDHTLVVTVQDPSYPNVCEIDKFVVNIASQDGNGGHVAGTTTVYQGPSGTSSPNNNGGTNNKKGSFPVAAVAGAVGGAAVIAIIIFWWWWIRRGDKAKKARRNSTSPNPKLKAGPGNVTPLLAEELDSPPPRDVEKGRYSRPGPIPNAPSSYTSSSPPPSSYTPSSPPPSTIHNLSQYPQHPYNNAAANPVPRPLSSISNTDTSYYTNMSTPNTGVPVGYPQNQQFPQPYQPQPQQQPVAPITPVWAIPASTSPQPPSQQVHSVGPSPSQSPAPVPAVLPAVVAPVQHQAPTPPSNTSSQYPAEKAVYRGSQAPSEKARYLGPHSQGPSSAGSGSGSGSAAPTSTAGAGSSAASATTTTAALTTPAETSFHDVITPDLPPPAYQM